MIFQFKASVWGVMQDQEAAQEEALQAEYIRKQQEEQDRSRDRSRQEYSYRNQEWDESM